MPQLEVPTRTAELVLEFLDAVVERLANATNEAVTR